LERKVYEWSTFSFNTDYLPVLSEEIKSSELSLQAHGVVSIRRLLSTEETD